MKKYQVLTGVEWSAIEPIRILTDPSNQKWYIIQDNERYWLVAEQVTYIGRGKIKRISHIPQGSAATEAGAMAMYVRTMNKEFGPSSLEKSGIPVKQQKKLAPLGEWEKVDPNAVAREIKTAHQVMQEDEDGDWLLYDRYNSDGQGWFYENGYWEGDVGKSEVAFDGRPDPAGRLTGNDFRGSRQVWIRKVRKSKKEGRRRTSTSSMMSLRGDN